MRTSIIIPLWNALSYTQQCLESIEAFTPEDHEIIFIDNGSTDGTTEWIKGILPKHPNYILIRNDKNLGAGAATNQGIQIATGDCLCFLNNDTVVSREWLKGLIECAESAEDIGLVGPKSNNVSGPQYVGDTAEGYDTIFKYQLYAENFRKAYRGLYIPWWRIIPFCGLIKRAVIDKIGTFDPLFFPYGNFGDDDFCLRACMAGYRNLICADVFIHHHGSVSMQQIDFAQNLQDNQVKFNAKWDKLTGKTISAVMIVKDERMNIGACLSQIYRHVDEIIVVDTGSKDRTKDIAAGCGNKVKVYDFEWCDDYSAARNFANSKATKDWILSVDADEIITGLDKVKLRPYHAYRIETRNYTNNPRWANSTENEGEYPEEQGRRWFPSTKIRLWSRDDRIKFEYPVHEVVENSVYHLGMGIVECPEVVVHHYGRLCDDYEYGRGAKYYDLLHKQFESGKNDLRSLEQLALHAQGVGKFAEARGFWEQVLNLDPTSKAAPFNVGHCFAEEGNWEAALEWTRKASAADPESRFVAMNLATCEAMAGDRNLAEKICADLIAKYPSYPLPQGLLNALEISKQQTGGKEDGDIKIC